MLELAQLVNEATPLIKAQALKDVPTREGITSQGDGDTSLATTGVGSMQPSVSPGSLSDLPAEKVPAMQQANTTLEAYQHVISQGEETTRRYLQAAKEHVTSAAGAALEPQPAAAVAAAVVAAAPKSQLKEDLVKALVWKIPAKPADTATTLERMKACWPSALTWKSGEPASAVAQDVTPVGTKGYWEQFQDWRSTSSTVAASSSSSGDAAPLSTWEKMKGYCPTTFPWSSSPEAIAKAKFVTEAQDRLAGYKKGMSDTTVLSGSYLTARNEGVAKGMRLKIEDNRRAAEEAVPSVEAKSYWTQVKDWWNTPIPVPPRVAHMTAFEEGFHDALKDSSKVVPKDRSTADQASYKEGRKLALVTHADDGT